jgi:glutathione S-transferase
MRLWGRATSVNVQKALWALEELGLAYERIDAGGAYGGTDTPEYRSMNPNRLVPTLQDGGLVLWESNAIVRYLADAYGRARLRPEDPKTAAVADQWMDWQQTTLAGALTPLFWETVRKPPSQRSPERIKDLLGQSGKLLGVLDALLADREWLAGDAFSMGDIPAGAMLWRWYTMEMDRPVLPNVDRWYERLSSRPAYRKTVMTGYEALRGKD